MFFEYLKKITCFGFYKILSSSANVELKANVSETELVLKILVSDSMLTWLFAWENFIAFIDHEIFKSYVLFSYLFIIM